MLKIITLLLAGFFANQALGFQCYLTMMKDTCWANYDVTIQVLDSVNKKTLATVAIPKGQTWGRQSFDCQANQELLFDATYSPVFWKADEGKTYHGKNAWQLPSSIEKGKIAWDITLCYGDAFYGIPLPPDAMGNCHCDSQGIPAITP